MGFLDGKDLWAFVSSSKRWRKISDEVGTHMCEDDDDDDGDGDVPFLLVVNGQLSVWERKYQQRFGKNASVPGHLQKASWIERYIKWGPTRP